MLKNLLSISLLVLIWGCSLRSPSSLRSDAPSNMPDTSVLSSELIKAGVSEMGLKLTKEPLTLVLKCDAKRDAKGFSACELRRLGSSTRKTKDRYEYQFSQEQTQNISTEIGVGLNEAYAEESYMWALEINLESKFVELIPGGFSPFTPNHQIEKVVEMDPRWRKEREIRLQIRLLAKFHCSASWCKYEVDGKTIRFSSDEMSKLKSMLHSRSIPIEGFSGLMVLNYTDGYTAYYNSANIFFPGYLSKDEGALGLRVELASNTDLIEEATLIKKNGVYHMLASNNTIENNPCSSRIDKKNGNLVIAEIDSQNTKLQKGHKFQRIWNDSKNSNLTLSYLIDGSQRYRTDEALIEVIATDSEYVTFKVNAPSKNTKESSSGKIVSFRAFGNIKAEICN